ncbi:hypothetical protein B0H34DRAFT_801873 [Crassisporium funariophilum]|nr:hypothetical protein B0H34DRAFT_801873 [Crassisporium funariophilum]
MRQTTQKCQNNLAGGGFPIWDSGSFKSKRQKKANDHESDKENPHTGSGPSQVMCSEKAVVRNATSISETAILALVNVNTPGGMDTETYSGCGPPEEWLQAAQLFFPDTDTAAKELPCLDNNDMMLLFEAPITCGQVPPDKDASSPSESEAESKDSDILPALVPIIESDDDSDTELDLSDHSDLFSDDEGTPSRSTPQAAPKTPHASVPTLSNINAALKPLRNKGPGYKDPGLNPFVRKRMEAMAQLLSLFTNDRSKLHDQWILASFKVAVAQQKGEMSYAQRIRAWPKAYIQDCNKVPINPYGKWSESRMEDEDLAQAITAHLQSLGPYIKARNIVNFLDRPNICAKYGLKKSICEQTARKWMHKMGYHWSMDPKGQYVNGHEQDDVVDYRQNIFLPGWASAESSMRTYTRAGEAV